MPRDLIPYSLKAMTVTSPMAEFSLKIVPAFPHQLEHSVLFCVKKPNKRVSQHGWPFFSSFRWGGLRILYNHRTFRPPGVHGWLRPLFLGRGSVANKVDSKQMSRLAYEAALCWHFKAMFREGTSLGIKWVGSTIPRIVFVRDHLALTTATCFVLFSTTCQLSLASVGKHRRLWGFCKAVLGLSGPT